MFKELKILNFQDSFDLNVAKFVYSTLAGQNPAIFSEWFTYTSNVHSHATTSSVTITQNEYFDVGTAVPTRTLFTRNSHLVKYGGKMIRVYGPKLWNSLPTDIQDSTSLATFKIELKKYFINRYIGNNNNNHTDNNTTRNRNNNQSNINNNNNNNNNSRRNHRSALTNNTRLNRPFVSRWNQQS